ncbi:MAG TPA: D-glucuronyl C5-epimerase family protein [Crocinitomicaceae bacterium]|nr:D-glucuronyl C5-epimerase family protein [Crocinitomicaceae bacterium]
MKGVDNSLHLGVGHIAHNTNLGGYYQNITPAITHVLRGEFATLDENGIPYLGSKNAKHYSPVLIIQYGLMAHDLLKENKEKELNEQRFITCINWLEGNKHVFNDGIVWRSVSNKQYNLPDGWVSGMYQGQAISIYLRAYQHFQNESYLETAKLIFNSFKYDYSEGGFKRIDENGHLWFEEYPTNPPSFVLNGYIYSILGIYDFYRVTQDGKALDLWNECVTTLEKNLHKYDVWYWSVYDQSKKQLVSYYYQKNVHVPLMQIMYQLTEKDIFNKYAIKWEKSLNNSFHRFITQIMYRIQPRIKKLIK